MRFWPQYLNIRVAAVHVNCVEEKAGTQRIQGDTNAEEGFER